jgi:hypothetical protein
MILKISFLMMNMNNGYLMRVLLMAWDLVPCDALGPLYLVKRKVLNEQMNR